MSLPNTLELQFELIEHFPGGKIFDCFRVKERKSKRPRELVLRLLPASFNDKKAVIDEFHSFFLKLSNLTNRSHIPIVYSVAGTIGGPVYVLEQYVSGVGLPEYIEKHRSSNTLIDDLTEIVVRVCEGLHFAHQKDIFHCCIAPDDILIDPDNPKKVKLVGFGAEILIKTGHLNAISESFGKFTAPEIASRVTIDTGCDIYSLATALSDACPEISFWNDLLAKSKLTDPLQRSASAREFGRELRKLADTSNKQVPEPAPGDLITGGLNPVLTIRTDPEWAEVWSHGKMLGISTNSGVMVAWKPGTILEIRKAGYSVETLDLSTPPDNTDINVKLQSSLILYTNPWGATVYINGEIIGITTYQGLMIPWDKGEIIIEKQGFKFEKFKFENPLYEKQCLVELEPATAPVAHGSKHTTPLQDEWNVSGRFWDRLANVISEESVTFLKTIPEFKALAYGFSGLLVLFLAIVLASWPTKPTGIHVQKTDLGFQLQQKDTDIEKLTAQLKSTGIDFDKQVSDLRSRVRLKDTEIERLAQAEKNLKIDVDKQVVGLRAELSNKAAEIAKLTQLDQEKTKLQTELQKQLNDLKSTILSKDRDISRLSQVERENQQLQTQLQSLKKVQSQPPQSPMPPVLTGNHSLNTELISAASSRDDARLRAVLGQGADPNFRNSAGHTALMLAAMRGNLEVVKTLLRQGADKNLESNSGDTALDYAKRNQYTNIVAWLSQNSGGQTPSPTTKPVIHNLDNELISAASNGNSHEVSRLLAQGADPNSRNSDGYTPLMLASINGHFEVVKTLLKSGADKSIKSRLGWTALDFAREYNHPNIATLLNTQSGVSPPTITEGLGIAIEKLLPDVASKIMPGDRHGFVVKSVISDGIGSKMGLRPDDVIVEVDGTTFAYMVELDKLWVASTRNGVIRVKIRRGTTAIFLARPLN